MKDIDTLTASFWYTYMIAEVIVFFIPLTYFASLFTNAAHSQIGF
jgi:hypothetical protein